MSKSSLVWALLAHDMPLKQTIPILRSSLTVPFTAQKQFRTTATLLKIDQSKYLKEIPFTALGASFRSLSSVPPLQRTWFLLLDSQTGEPYKGSSADKVSLLPNADVADFRDAVKAKYSDSLLKGIAPSTLTVYENKDAFEQWKKGNEKVNHNRLMADKADG
jgi:hypothetical protein